MTKRIIWTAASVLGAAAISSSLTVLAVSRQYADRSSSLSFAGGYEQYNSAATGKEMPDGSYSYHAVDIPDDVRVEEITYGNAADMIHAGDDFILYFGFPDCYYCRYEISALTRALADTDCTPGQAPGVPLIGFTLQRTPLRCCHRWLWLNALPQSNVTGIQAVH